MPHGRSGPELAAAHPDESGGKDPCGRADGVTPDGRKDLRHRWAGPPEAHGGRRLPAGHVPRGAAGPDEREKRAAGALVPLPPGSAPGVHRTGHRRCKSHACGVRRAPGQRGFTAYRRHSAGVGDAGLSAGAAVLHEGQGKADVPFRGLFPVPQHGE